MIPEKFTSQDVQLRGVKTHFGSAKLRITPIPREILGQTSTDFFWLIVAIG